MYVQDNEYKMPKTGYGHPSGNGHLWFDDSVTPPRPKEHDDDYAYWGITYKDYVKDRKLFGCPSFRNFLELLTLEPIYQNEDPDSLREAAYCINNWLSEENINSFRHPLHEIIVSHDHMEPKVENGSPDMLYMSSNGTPNLKQYRDSENGNRWKQYRGIFRHNIRASGIEQTGGSLNILWLDSHVSNLKETYGEEILKRYYDPKHEH